MSENNLKELSTPIAIVVAGGLIAIGVYFSGIHGSTGAAQPSLGGQQLVTTAAQMRALINKDRVEAYFDPAAKGSEDAYIGKADAPVTMTYWFDYQCPFCKQFEETVMPTLIKDYVNTGKLRIVFKDYAFLGNDSLAGAEYAEAVWELYPEKFFEWQSAMFDVQDAEGDAGFGNAATIETLTKLIPGIDVAKVKALVAQKKTAYDQKIAAEQQDGATQGVTGTPGFVIGTQSISGAQNVSVFTAAIDAALAGH